jgi:hypothetical protein
LQVGLNKLQVKSWDNAVLVGVDDDLDTINLSMDSDELSSTIATIKCIAPHATIVSDATKTQMKTDLETLKGLVVNNIV